MTQWPVYLAHKGPIVIIGFGSIAKGFLPLLERHIGFDRSRLTVIAPNDADRALLDQRGIRFIKAGLTPDNFREILTPLLARQPADETRGLIVNLSVDVSSVAIIDFARDIDVWSIDTVCEPWLGYYADPALTVAQRSNYALRESLLDQRRRRPGGVTAVNCCGANPGLVSWLVKQALVNLAGDLGIDAGDAAARTRWSRDEWARLMQRVGVKGVHIAERDTQLPARRRERGVFVNTWSVEGFIAEGLQPAELGWGTHEKTLPPEAQSHTFGCGAGIYLQRPGAGVRVRTWTPTAGPQHGWLITHNEAISIADYFTVRENDRVVYRPTCHYAYRPCDDAVLSLDELAGAQWQPQEKWHILAADEIVDGMDELGVLLYGHGRNAYWFGSQLTIDETRRLAPHQNATGLQVTAAVLAGIVWMAENPERGIVEADELDYRRCLDIAGPYLGELRGYYTDWTPLTGRAVLFPESIDTEDPWQFRNVIVRG